MIPHLALFALLLPLWILLFYVFPCHLDKSMKSGPDMVGILCYFIIPGIMVLMVILKGTWRLAFVVGLGSFFLQPMIHAVIPGKKTHRSDDDHVLKFDILKAGYPERTEVFCNGVKMGEIPCEFTVRQLKEKVPRWTTPPRQERYHDGKMPLYTWIPWDGFVRARFKERREVSLREGTGRFDNKSEFWWSFRYEGTTAFGGLRDEVYREDRFRSYRSVNHCIQIIYPDAYTEYDLLMKILEEDSPPEGPFAPAPEWIDLVAEKGRLMDDLFEERGRFEVKRPLEPILRTIARKRYGLSEVPTSSECGYALSQMIHEDERCPVVSVEGIYTQNVNWKHTDIFGDIYSWSDKYMIRTLREMGNACREPLLRLCRNRQMMDYFKGDRKSKLLLCFLKEHPFPEFFDEMVQFYAMQNRGLTTLMAFDDPRLPALLKTILRKKAPFSQIESGVRSAFLVKLENPLLEKTIRDFIAEEITWVDEEKVEPILTAYAESRNNMEWINRQELARWIRSLDIDARHKTQALGCLSLSENNPDLLLFILEGKSFQKDRRNAMGRFSLKEVERHLQEYPDGGLDDAIRTVLDENASETDAQRARDAFLVHSMRELGETFVRGQWSDPTRREQILELIRIRYSTTYYYDKQKKYREQAGDARWEEFFYLPGNMISIGRNESYFYVSRFPGTMTQGRSRDYLIPLFDELENPEDCVYLPDIIFGSAAPEARRLLEKWGRSSNVQLRTNAERVLGWMEYREKLHKEGRRIYEDLVAGRIVPDEIIPSPMAWTWDGKVYVTEKYVNNKSGN